MLEDQPTTLGWFEAEQTCLREHTPAALIVWGTNDGHLPEASARDGGHWLLETHLHEVVPLVRGFLERVYP